MASRRFIGRGVLELAISHARRESKPDIVELLDDIRTTKIGLGLSGFGMIVSGWGMDFGRWSYSYLLPSGLSVILDARRDFVCLRQG